MYLKYSFKSGLNFQDRLEFKQEEKSSFTFAKKNSRIAVGGKFYYFNSVKLKNIPFGKNPEKKLEKLLKANTLPGFIDIIEGEYWGVEINDSQKTVRIFSDKLKQQEIYYFSNRDFFIASTDPEGIIKDAGQPAYKQNALVSSLLLHLPKGHAIFKGLKRLRYNEILKIKDNEVFFEKHQDKDTEITPYSQKDFADYENIVKQAILSRASDKMNLVFSSGGWDSTLIMAILSKYLGPEKVAGVTMKITFSDGRCFNTYEIAKVKKIASLLKVKSDIIEMDYQKEKLYPRIEEVKDNLFYKGLFFLAPANWSKTVSYIKEKYGEDVVIFHGEGCDSLHNFGFSQFETLFHDSEDFRAYADKMAGYLFSPSFFKKLKDNSFLKDNVYRIFRALYSKKEFVEAEKMGYKDKLFYYLFSFIFSDLRIPFRKVGYEKYIKEPAFKKFESWIRENYFKEAIEDINEKNLYYNFLRLYVSFHLQSPQIHIYRTGLKNVRFPYIDMNLFKFLSRMPEHYGRGLEFKPTKFPEKILAKKVLPKKLVEMLEAGPHSYLYEIEDMNPYDEYLLKGSVYERMRKKMNVKKIRKIFDEKIFKVKELEGLANDFKAGRLKKLSGVQAKALLMLMLFSINEKA